MNIIENFSLALTSVRANKLRTFLTLLSVSIGVFAITGAGALVESINSTVTSQMDELGETVYYVQRTPLLQMGGGPGYWRKWISRKHLTYRQFQQLQEKSTIPTDMCVYADGGTTVVKHNELKTDNNVAIIPATASFMPMLNYHPEKGRAFTEIEVQYASKVAVIGSDVASKLFPNSENAVGKTIKIDAYTFTIIGVTKPKGSMMGQSQDNYVIVPISWYIRYYSTEGNNTDLRYAIKAPNMKQLNASMDETIGILRSIRNCNPWEDNSFDIADNQALMDQFSSMTQYLSIFGAACGAIALLAAGVGIANMMLVSVKERTREIGIRKAVGAKSSSILLQFLVEAVTLCLLGAFIGIFIGVLIGGVFGKLVGMSLGIPYMWILFSLITCILLGIISGAYPAWRAAKLDPIESLRYE